MPSAARNVLLLQLPIPPAGDEPIRGNVPLAAAYLKLFAERRGLGAAYAIEILSTREANTLGDHGLVESIAARRPWMVGFTCYLWNIERTLWIAESVKERCPETTIVLGGPEIAADNGWVLAHPAVDYAIIGEGEQTFAELLASMIVGRPSVGQIDGLYVRPRDLPADQVNSALAQGALAVADSDTATFARLKLALPRPRRPLPNLEEISSPYLSGILDAADERMMLLETIRGCVFKCKFCYYPKSYDKLYFLSREKVLANLAHARGRGAREVVLMDPTLNQRPDFDDLLRLLIEGNPDQQFTYFGELRAEGIRAETARLMRRANFTEVEIGLQSIDPLAQDLMDRRNHLKAFERGVRALADEGISVKVDLIIGLPGDTRESVRRGLQYLRSLDTISGFQVFNLAILPGTAFRAEAEHLGLVHQPRPPYYVLRTPTLELGDMYDLMDEAQTMFDVEFDAIPPAVIEFEAADEGPRVARFDLDGLEQGVETALVPAAERRQAFTLWFRATDFDASRQRLAEVVRGALDENPFTTLQVVLEPKSDPTTIGDACLEALWAEFLRRPSYLDRFHAVAPAGAKGAKRIVVHLNAEARARDSAAWRELIGDRATISPANLACDGAAERDESRAPDIEVIA